LSIAALAAAMAMTGASGASAQAPCPNVGFTVVERSASPATRPVKDGFQTLFVRRDAITNTADITEFKLAGDNYDTLVQLKLKPDAAKRLHDVTTSASGLRLAFVADNSVLSAVTWEGPYGMDADLGVQLSIPHGMARAKALADALHRCAGSVVR
jgi:preprotein translocase subunit SecD